jgi:hypothetical protein
MHPPSPRLVCQQLRPRPPHHRRRPLAARQQRVRRRLGRPRLRQQPRARAAGPGRTQRRGGGQGRGRRGRRRRRRARGRARARGRRPALGAVGPAQAMHQRAWRRPPPSAVVVLVPPNKVSLRALPAALYTSNAISPPRPLPPTAASPLSRLPLRRTPLPLARTPSTQPSPLPPSPLAPANRCPNEPRTEFYFLFTARPLERANAQTRVQPGDSGTSAPQQWPPRRRGRSAGPALPHPRHQPRVARHVWGDVAVAHLGGGGLLWGGGGWGPGLSGDGAKGRPGPPRGAAAVPPGRVAAWRSGAGGSRGLAPGPRACR